LRKEMLMGIVRNTMQLIPYCNPKQIIGVGFTSNSDLSIPVYAHSAQITVR